MKLFCNEDHSEPPKRKTFTKYAFSFRATEGFLGKKETYGRLEDAILFDEKPSPDKYWDLLREYHPHSVLFNYHNPYRIAEIEFSYNVVGETYF